VFLGQKGNVEGFFLCFCLYYSYKGNPLLKGYFYSRFSLSGLVPRFTFVEKIDVNFRI